MKRCYESVIEGHFEGNRQMLFLVGPRQVGKTTTSREIADTRPKHFYLNWDDQEDRKLILQGPEAIAIKLKVNESRLGEPLPFVIFDELHKYKKWKTFIKGFFDKYSKNVQILITGSARLDIYKRGGDSLMGRYFLYRLHPISVAELFPSDLKSVEISPPRKISQEDFDALFEFGGFPEPFLKRDPFFYSQWKRLRFLQLFKEDLRDLTKIQDFDQMEILAELLSSQTSQLMSYTSLANKVNVSVDTIRRWVGVLKSFYYCFTLKPWTKNVTRSLIKEPKVYLWDWSFVQDKGARVENFIASHLHKAVHYWTDRGFGEYELYFLRDKEKREVDFLVSKNKKPWFIVEAKTSKDEGISKSLYYFQEMTKAPHAFQVVFDADYIEADCFAHHQPIIVPAKTFLSQLI
jgi:predicted AAA+ superfamily ATPase